MNRVKYTMLPLAIVALTACESQAEQQADITEDRIEQQAEASAAQAGNAVAAFGMSERQLLDAELKTMDGTDLGDVEGIRRNAAGEVESLLIEVEDSDPDRWVLVPIDGLSTRPDGGDMDLQTSMTAQDIAALPDAQLNGQ